MADNARFVQASQLNMAGTGIGTFSDRLRDAVRGGGPFDEDPRIQGFGSGLYTDPNGAAVNGSPAEQLARLLHSEDLVKLGLAGNLRDFTFVDRTRAGREGLAGRLQRPARGLRRRPGRDDHLRRCARQRDAVRRAAVQAAHGTSMADRVRMNTVALATTALGQSPSFWHAGNDILRSKSLDRNSYDSGDWFNRVDWSYATRRGDRACRRRRTTRRSGTSSGRCWPTRPSRPDAADIRAAHSRAGSCWRSGRPRRCSASAAPR